MVKGQMRLNKILLRYRESDEQDEVPAPKISKYFGKKTKEENGQDEIPEIARRKSQFFSYRELQQTSSIF